MARILVVEDEPIARRLVVRILQRAGHEVRGAAGVQEALDACREFAPQVAVLDWLLSGNPDGGTVARFLHAHCPATRIIFLSGCPAEAIQSCVEDVPVLEFLTKPIGFQELYAAVDRAFAA
jgi:CheY-like chemotaxis protein